jgi:hypothetical protein
LRDSSSGGVAVGAIGTGGFGEATLSRTAAVGAAVCVTPVDLFRAARHRATRMRVVFCPRGLLRYLRSDSLLFADLSCASHSGEHGTGA